MHARHVMLCSEILDLHWRSKEGDDRQVKANLEEIWPSGARFQTNVPIGRLTALWFSGGGCEFRGHVARGVSIKEIGYFVEMRFNPGCVWSERKYRPKHHFNPLLVLADRIFEDTLCLHGSMSAGTEPSVFGPRAAREHTIGN